MPLLLPQTIARAGMTMDLDMPTASFGMADLGCEFPVWGGTEHTCDGNTTAF